MIGWGAAVRRGLCAAVLGLAAACGQAPPAKTTYGEKPDLVAPRPQAMMKTKIAPAVGWPAGAAPTAPEGFKVTRFAGGLDHPQWLYVLPNGDVLVAESTGRQLRGGLTDMMRNWSQSQAGLVGQSPDRITLLRDANQDGVAEQRFVFLEGLNQPFGMALLVNALYVANTDALLRFPYTDGQTRITAIGEQILALPRREPDNGDWTRNILVKLDGTKIYVAVGAAGNIANYGLRAEERRGNILELNPNGSGARVFASGMRNPVGMAWEPVTGALWAAVDERDGLGDDVPPDYMTRVRDGGFYGWPWTYFGKHRDPRVNHKAPEGLLDRALTPDYALGAHGEARGLAFYRGGPFPTRYLGGAFISQSGSWNRSALTGYRVIFVPFANGAPSGPPQPFLTGFVNEKGQAQGRPTGVVVDPGGALLVADDTGGSIWRVTATR
ncbi:MAG: sorbosone dehydrogenase family protein [Hyphomonadaceae bacterium]